MTIAQDSCVEIEEGGDAVLADLLDEAQRAEQRGRHDRARESYELALRSLGRSLTPATASDLCRRVAVCCVRLAEFDGAMDSIVAALAIATAGACEEEVAGALNVLAGIHWNRGEHDAAFEHFGTARAVADRAGSLRIVGVASVNLGVIATVRGDYGRAERCYEAGLTAYRTLGMTHEAAVALNNLGMLRTYRSEWHEAQAAFGEALALAGQLGDRGLLPMLHMNRAEVHIALSQFEAARAEIERGRAIAEELDDAAALGASCRHLGVIARETGHYRHAEELFRRGEVNAARRQDVMLTAELARERADLYARQGRYRDTVRYLNDAHRIFTALQASRDLADVARRTSRVESSFLDVVRRWGESIESKDTYTQGHCVRVSDLACAVARRLGYDQRRLFWFRVGALLHDVGKISIPAEVLNKPGRLTPSEWALMRAHPALGVDLLTGIDFPDDVLPIVRSHHEKWDGSGYPDGLKANAIALGARILGVADVYDALTTDRSYKPGLPHTVAMEIMRRDVGTHFDPEVFGHFEVVMAERERAV